MPHMIEPLCLICGTDSRRLFLAVFQGWENGFVPAGELFRRPSRMKQLHGLVRVPRAVRKVCSGSISTELGYPDDVRFTLGSDQTTDIPDRQLVPPHHWLSLSVECWIARRLSSASKRILPALFRAAMRSGPPGILCAALSAASAVCKSNSHCSGRPGFCVFMHHRDHTSE